MPYEVAECKTEEFQRDIWQPLTRRVDIMTMTQEIPSTAEEPYTVNQLAHALQYLTEHPELVEKMNEIDYQTKPDYVAHLTWAQGVEKEQKDAFERLLDKIEIK